jgi:predicted GH43/DUF377 family glycosyl hydrolase
MKWAKQGLIYAPDGRRPWAKHYAFPPTPLFLPDGRLRLYCAFCDEHTVGRMGYVDVDPEDPKRVLAVAEKPVLDIGGAGCFDENGLLPTTVLRVGEQVYAYYVGYQLGMKVRYYQFQGLAVSDDGGATFRRKRRTPVLERSDAEPHHRTSAFVMRDGDRFKAWYVGGDHWTEVNGKSLPVYSIKYLESDDGEHWGPTGEPCINLKDDDEHALGRPWVLKGDGLWRMFYSSRTRSKGYRLGYAESADGRRWTRKDDEVGIDVSPEGWDSQMIAYSSVVPYRDKVYLFYNGNNCGQTGFGYAVLEHW